MEPLLTEPQLWAAGTACVFMALDCLSGFLQAVVNGTVESTKMRQGILHKASMAVVITAVIVLEVAGTHVAGLQIDGVGTVPVCCIIVLMELVSIWENACKANPGLRDSPLGRLLGGVGEADGGGDGMGEE